MWGRGPDEQRNRRLCCLGGLRFLYSHSFGAWGWGPRRGGEAARKNAVAGASPLGVAPEDVDPVLADLRPQLGIGDAEALLGGQAEDADLALVEVVMDL